MERIDMTDQSQTAFTEDTAEVEAVPQVTPETEAEEIEPEAQEGETQEQAEKRKETWKERRERDKARKQQLRDDLAAANAKIAELTAQQEKLVAPAENSAKPKEVDFTDYADYIAAVTEWTLNQSSASREKQRVTEETDAAKSQAAALQQQEQALLWNNWDQQKHEAKDRYGDFDQVIGKGTFPENSPLLDMILRSESPADLAYHIAADAALNVSLLKMPPVEAARAIGRLEATITQPRPRTSSTAPAPITPLKGSAAATRDPAKLSMEEWIAGRASGKIR
jgi:hypothetical protein